MGGERDFHRAWDAIAKTEATLVKDVAEMLELRRADSQRKQENLHREWTAQVFAPIQAEIDATLSHRAATSDLGDRWRTAQDEYLAACVRKEAGLFRDIVIP